jgi:hypothetical protein
VSRSDLPARLRDALLAAEFTYDAVADLLGPVGHAALGRNETTPGLRRTTDGSPLATLTRLFLLQARVGESEVERALPGLLGGLVEEGVVDHAGGEVAARLDVRPYAADGRDLWVVSDLTPGLDGAPIAVGADHVLGISPASTSLARLTVRHRVGRALDLGTGCGVQALHLATHVDHVVATDVNPRALRMTRFNLALNDLAHGRVEVRDGSLFDPVAGERFDLIATNPPFVISPATDDRLVYRDSGLPGDAVVERIVRTAPAHLTPGGWCQVLANWAITTDLGWDERLDGWLPGEVDALVVQREVLDPAAYVELWLKDSGHHGSADHVARYDRWLAWFDDQRIEGIGFGWINLRAAGSGARTLLDWPYDVEQPIAPAVAAWGEAADMLARTDRVEDLRLVAVDALVQETQGEPGAEDPATIVLRQQRGLRRARRVDTVEAALVGACDGDLEVGRLLAALAHLLERDGDDLRAAYLPVVRELVAEGFLEAQAG